MRNRSALVVAILLSFACSSTPPGIGTSGPTGTATNAGTGGSSGGASNSATGNGGEESGGAEPGGASSGGDSGGAGTAGTEGTVAGSSSGGAAEGGASQGGDASQGGAGEGGDAPGGAGPDPDVDHPSPDFEGTVLEYLEQVNEGVLDLYALCLNISATYAQIDSRIIERQEYVAYRANTSVGSAEQSIDAGRLALDADAAGACLERAESLSCEELLRDLAAGNPCWEGVPLVGLVPRGEFCLDVSECADQKDYCAFNSNACPATWCAPRAKEGESCLFDACELGLDCIGVEDATCASVAALAEGEPCAGAAKCDAGLICAGTCKPYAESLPCASNSDCPNRQVCLFDPEASIGTCGVPKLEGEPCKNQSVGAHDCAESLDCVGEAGSETCAVSWAEVGEMCRNTGADHAIVCIEGTCGELDQVTQEGTCIPLAEEGEPCDQRTCRPGFECGVEEGECVPRLPPCRSVDCEAGNRCDGDECVPGIAPGEECAGDEQCGVGAACIGSLCMACE